MNTISPVSYYPINSMSYNKVDNGEQDENIKINNTKEVGSNVVISDEAKRLYEASVNNMEDELSPLTNGNGNEPPK